MSDARQFTPAGYPALPKMRTFGVRRPNHVNDELIEATGVRIETEGVLVFSELVYIYNSDTKQYEMVRFDRKAFRVWLDYEEILNVAPMLSSQLN